MVDIASISPTQSPFAAIDRTVPENQVSDANQQQHHLSAFADDDGPSFKDLVDIINPLQHIPIISTIYRKITGDEPGAVSRIIGSALYGGPIGMIAEEVNCIIDDETGDDIGGHVVAFLERQFSDPASDAAPESQLAAAAPTATEPPTPQAAPQTPVASEPATAPTTAAAAPLATLMADATPIAIKTSAPSSIAAAAQAPTPMPTPMPGDADAHFMPVPPRRSINVVPVPLVRVPVTTTSQRSNVPITGRPAVAGGPSASSASAAASIQQAPALQNAPIQNAAVQNAAATSIPPSAPVA
jgi:hypothetical protein